MNKIFLSVLACLFCGVFVSLYAQVTLVKNFSSPPLHTTLPDYGEIYGHGNFNNKTIEIFDANIQLVKEISVAGLMQPYMTYLTLVDVNQYMFNNDPKLEFRIGTSYDEYGVLESNWYDEDLNDLGIRGPITTLSGQPVVQQYPKIYSLPGLDEILDISITQYGPGAILNRIDLGNTTSFVVFNSDSLKLWVLDDQFNTIQKTSFSLCNNCYIDGTFLIDAAQYTMDNDPEFEFFLKILKSSEPYVYSFLDDDGSLIKEFHEKSEFTVLTNDKFGFSGPKLLKNTKWNNYPDTSWVYALPDFDLEYMDTVRLWAGKKATLTEGKFLAGFLGGGLKIYDENYQLERTILKTNNLSEFLDLPDLFGIGWEFLKVNVYQGINTGDLSFFSALCAENGDSMYTFPPYYRCKISEPILGIPKIICSNYTPRRFTDTKIYRLPFGTKTTSVSMSNPLDCDISIYPNPLGYTDLQVNLGEKSPEDFLVRVFSIHGKLL